MPTPPTYVWPEGKTSAFCFSVDVDAEAPMLWTHRRHFPNTFAELELRRFGPRVGIFRIIALLRESGIRGSFFVPGVVAEMHPEILPALVEAGHEVGLHGYFHELATETSDARFSEALERSLALFQRQIGLRPKGFRSPAWEMTPHMLAEVKRHGLYDSSLMGFDHPYSIGGVVEVPVQWITDDAVYFKFIGGGADRWPSSAPGPVLDGWLDEWTMIHRLGGLFMLTIHDWISGRAQRLLMLERLLARVTAENGVWVATVGELAEHHATSVNLGRFAVDAELPIAVDASGATG
jgi:peptidoglycan/xylan/chitin deacetylase (PgdA/CDA1 family)